MSVAVAITVTLPNYTAATFVATGTDVAQSIGGEVARLVQSQILAGKRAVDPGAVTVAASVT